MPILNLVVDGRAEFQAAGSIETAGAADMVCRSQYKMIMFPLYVPRLYGFCREEYLQIRTGHEVPVQSYKEDTEQAVSCHFISSRC